MHTRRTHSAAQQAHKKIVLIAGTFDLLHTGHRHFFAEAAGYGSVVAIVARDATVRRIKGSLPIDSERRRLARVAHSSGITRACLGHTTDLLQTVEHIRPDIIALGYDQQTFDIPTLRRELKKRNLTPHIIRLHAYRPQEFKSSLLRIKKKE